MGKGIYTYYKERLIEVGGNNKCLYLKSIVRKSAYDLGRIFEGRDEKVAEFVEFLHSNRKYPLTIMGSGEKKEVLQNLDISVKTQSLSEDGIPPIGEEAEKLAKKIERDRKNAAKRAIESEISKLKDLKREIEEIEKETGRYELYIGYPFVFGTLTQGFTKTAIKAPLMLFPVRIDIPDESTVELALNENEKIRINPALVFAYAQSKRINVDALELEFDDISKFKGIGDIVKYLRDAHIKIDWTHSKNVFAYSRFKEPTERELSVRYAAVLGRFPLSNSIYNDYSLLEKKKLTNDAVNELLRTGKAKRPAKKKAKRAKTQNTYIVKMLDYAQSKVVNKVNEEGNMVIYGPPGTGKSQTIVNIITDAICKHKRVLVVSQKKAALDVVYNRLGTLNSKAMYINDECKEKRVFYERCLLAHQNDMVESLTDIDDLAAQYDSIQQKIALEEQNLQTIYNTLNDKRQFGLSLSEMYSSSTMLSKNSADYGIYTKLIENEEIMALNYSQLCDALFVIKGENLEKLYYNFMLDKEKNPLIDHMQPGVDIRTLSEVKAQLEEIQKTRKGFFNTAKFPYYRQVMAYYKELSTEENIDFIVKHECKLRYPEKIFTRKLEREIKEKFLETIKAVDDFVKEYDCLHKVLTLDGYIAVIDNILRGNTSYTKHVYDALDNYIALRDINKLIESLDRNKIILLNFAYTVSKSYANYVYVIEKLMELRIYHEVIHYEEICKDELAKMVDFPNITDRIYKLKEQQLEVSTKLAAGKNSREYEELYNTAKNNKDYLYQISKKQKFWPVRKTMEIYGEFILSLFPCWLLSPENVSTLLPLQKNMFDVVIFDEASQVFIESTIPTIYRGKNIVVAGDSKQLRPSTTFMKRYLGGDPEAQDDFAVQAALEVESLLDLAVARYESENLTYHYRSRNSELIDFSNAAFYSSDLQIAPNTSKNLKNRPIERHKVAGKWIERKNQVEAKKIVEILKDIFKTRKNNESIGIITFNSDQQSCIADTIDKEAMKDPEFRSSILKETHRIEGGEDTSMFIKNLENVQGDERDIIIFSIGYAQNAEGKVYTNFGSLSADGGENRLNVAITRAKSKVIVVTSIEPEALKVENSKHLGPKLLKKYLMYVRAVANGDTEEVGAILSELNTAEPKPEAAIMTTVESVEEQIKEKLTKLGYKVDTDLGNINSRISLAIYDEKKDRYLVGIELDKDAFASSDSCMERDVYKPKFLTAKGWTLLRVWCRDWWLYPQRVIKSIVAAAEKNK
jgi:KaiC/GvpD/RAD55 family RecA-like ATPase